MNEMATKPPTLWTKGRGPITANPRMVELAAMINQLLVAPIDVLPDGPEAIVKPFAIGISPRIEARIKPDASLSDLKVRIRKYTHHKTYLLASAQPSAMRHDIDGNPVEPVSDEHRLSAMIAWKTIQDAIEKRRKEEQEQAAA